MHAENNKINRRSFVFQSLLFAVATKRKTKFTPIVKPNRTIKKICVDAYNRKIIIEDDANAICPPASLVKLMLMYLVALKIIKKEVKLEDEVVPKRTIFPKNNSDIIFSTDKRYKLGYLMDAIAIISSNTSAVTVAEYLWGSESKCIEDMNSMAKKLEMKNTKYFTVNGYPIKSGGDLDRTTAKDLANLALECCKLPVLLSWTSKKKFIIQDENIERSNTNDLLTTFVGCDGLKTGYTKLAGHCIVATARRNKSRVIAVVLGAEKSSERFRVATNLLEIGFSEIS
ncbi:MAG: D-alanyl-D-alanine carboxypeptidase family protein [Candidatus Hydrogenedens sp.]